MVFQQSLRESLYCIGAILGEFYEVSKRKVLGMVAVWLQWRILFLLEVWFISHVIPGETVWFMIPCLCVSRNCESPVTQRFVRERVKILLPPHCSHKKNKSWTLSVVGRRRRSLLSQWRDTGSPLASSPLPEPPRTRGGSQDAGPRPRLLASVWTENRTRPPNLLSESRASERGCKQLY